MTTLAAPCAKCGRALPEGAQFCPTCGVQPYALGQMPDGSKMAAINVRCLEDFDLESVERTPVNGREF